MDMQLHSKVFYGMKSFLHVSNFNNFTIEVKVGVSNCILLFYVIAITYPCPNLSASWYKRPQADI